MRPSYSERRKGTPTGWREMAANCTLGWWVELYNLIMLSKAWSERAKSKVNKLWSINCSDFAVENYLINAWSNLTDSLLDHHHNKHVGGMENSDAQERCTLVLKFTGPDYTDDVYAMQSKHEHYFVAQAEVTFTRGHLPWHCSSKFQWTLLSSHHRVTPLRSQEYCMRFFQNAGCIRG